MKTYNKTRFKQVMLGISVYDKLKSAKETIKESFSDVISRLLEQPKSSVLGWSYIKPVETNVKEFYRSELFA